MFIKINHNPRWVISASIQVKLDTDTDLDTDFVNKINYDLFIVSYP
jgi:hypothetical protein